MIVKGLSSNVSPYKNAHAIRHRAYAPGQHTGSFDDKRRDDQEAGGEQWHG
jgi:hypothetical protein